MKIVGVSALDTSSFFPATKIMQRSVDQRVGNFSPMSKKLAERLTQALDAELLALFSIPLLSTLMSHSVAHSNDFLWQVEDVFAHVALIALGTNHVR